MAELVGELPYKFFSASSGYKCIYDYKNEKIMEINPAMKNLMGTNENIDFDVIFFYKNDTDKFITLNGIPCRLHILGKLTDSMCIAEMTPSNTNKWKQNSGDSFVKVMDITSDGIWEWYPLVNFEYMSNRFWTILGYGNDDMEESPDPWMGLIDENDKKTAMSLFKDHVDSHGDKPYRYQVKYTHKEGKTVHVFCRGFVTDWLPDGKPWRVMGTHTDVTDVVKKDAVEAKAVFISRMSHEIRSPVCTIINECELLDMEHKTMVIMDTCKQLISITDDILSLGHLKNSNQPLRCTKEDLYDILSKCTKRHRIQAKKDGLTIRTDIGYLPDFVMVDVGKFNQIIDNLINNSIKNTKKGKIVIEAEYNEETCICSIKIIDTGVGIPSDMRSKIFEEFVQGDQNMTGAGIGLTLVKRFSKIMDGDVVIESSEVGVGTTMLFTSKLSLPGNETETPKIKKVKKEHKSGGFNILIVDDMYANRAILKRRLDNLKRMGINYTDVVEAVNGKEAVDKFIEHNGNFQLVLMDCLMPIMDGFSSTTAIHSECDRLGIEPVPVVAVTASLSSDIHSKCFDSGMKYVVTKPYSEHDLLISVKSCIPLI